MEYVPHRKRGFSNQKLRDSRQTSTASIYYNSILKCNPTEGNTKEQKITKHRNANQGKDSAFLLNEL
jgi:hypothetical protein